MREYIFTVLGAALVAGAVMLILPQNAKCARQVKLIVSLCVTCAVSAPLAALAGADVTDFLGSLTFGAYGESGAEEIYYGVLTELGASELEELLTARICENFGLRQVDLNVTVEACGDGGSFRPTRVAVGLSGAAVLTDPYEIEEYVTSLVGCTCETYW